MKKFIGSMLILFISLNVSAKTSCISLLIKILDSNYRLRAVAQRGLEKNIQSLPSGKYLSAGPHQFKTLWTRDFAWSNRGLMEIGREDVLKHHIETLLEFRQDGLVPKALDSMSPPKRTVMASVDGLHMKESRSLPLTDPLTAYFKDENGSVAIDSNILVLKAAIEYVEKSGDTKWWAKVEDGLVDIFRYYDHHFDNGLIKQMKYSDWQDSVTRVGHTSYTNVLYYIMSKKVADNPKFGVNAAELAKYKARIIDTFLDDSTGLMKSVEGEEFISLDTNLLMLDMDFWGDSIRARQHYEALVNSPFFNKNGGLAGWNTFPNYPYKWRSVASKVAFVPYHDRLYWSWLMAYAGKISHKFGDELRVNQILDALKNLANTYDEIGEIFAKGTDAWKTPFYNSETPFSWGSAFVLDFLGSI